MCSTAGSTASSHVHLADTQGRGEPGSGTMDWQARLDWLADHGYAGFVGLEYRPTNGTLESLQFPRAERSLIDDSPMSPFGISDQSRPAPYLAAKAAPRAGRHRR